ncbi:hypothetical protein DC083_03280 [Ignatzschineria ureiclastica]|uniref:Uncharacterized protein n=1 Tax=Ignatzschineria ureiclastica TaxID=472582 RepID=A0A2U2AFP9_9GAMM|nr:hypothetical protein [Ignatzschineria ureiclastica]PWD81482.1 hypothetical protein DC083_03280 [Ignatzschineria ureiclastica]GHA01005.1 hypothetical protein GCM10007162_16630 [Ignatzschineria ureiclastica]
MIYSKFGLRKMFFKQLLRDFKKHQIVLNSSCKMPDRTAFALLTTDAPAFKGAYVELTLL